MKLSDRLHRFRPLAAGAFALLTLALVLGVSSAWAQVPVLYYDFENTARTAFENLTEQQMAAGSGPITRAGNTTVVSGVSGAGTFNGGAANGQAATGSNWSSSTTDLGASATDYYQFTVATSGLAGASVTFDDQASLTGPAVVGVSYSTNGATYTATSVQATSNNAFASHTFDLSAITAIDNIASVTFRIYAYAGNATDRTGRSSFASGGTYRIDNLTVRERTINASKLLVNHAAIGLGIRSGTAYNPTYSSLTVNSPAGLTIAASDVNLNGVLTVNSGATALFSTNLTLLSGASGVLNNSCTVNSGGAITVNSGANLATAGTLTNNGTVTVTGTFQLNQGGFAGGNSFVYVSPGTLVFNNSSGSYGVSSGHAYWGGTANDPPNVTVAGAGGITMTVARTVSGTFQTAAGVLTANNLTLNGTAQINAGGFFTGSPTYGSSSTLIYNTPAGYGVGAEWTGSGAGAGGASAAGSGQPQNVTVNAGTLGLDANPRALPGNLTISAGGLALTAGGDLAVGGNWSRSAGTSFFHNNVGVWFIGSGSQLLAGPAAGETFGYLILKNTGTVSLSGADVSVTGTTGDALQLLSAGTLDLNGRTVTLSGGGALKVNGGVRNINATGSGTLFFTALTNINPTNAGSLGLGSTVKAEISAGVTFNSTTLNGSLQLDGGGFVNTTPPTYGGASTLIYNSAAGYGVAAEWATGSTAGFGVPQNVTVTTGAVTTPGTPRTVPGSLVFNGGSMTLGANLAVNGALALGSSVITTGSNKVTLGTGVAVTRTSGYVNGTLEKTIASGSPSPNFEIGDATNYTPVAIALSGVTNSTGLLAAKTTGAAGAPPAGSNLSTSKYVNRLWQLDNSGVAFSNYSATFNFINPGDLVGSPSTAALNVAKNTTGVWSNPTVGTRTSTSTQATGLTAFSTFYLGEPGTYTITASAGAGGSISPTGAVTVASGGSQTFLITPNACFAIADVKVDGVSVGTPSSYPFTSVTANHTIAATFVALGPYTIAASAGTGGSISPSGNVSVNCGGSQTFTITPDACHTIAQVSVNGVGQGAISSYTFTNVQANATIAATFNLINYTIAASAGSNGSISPNGNVSVGCGSNQSFTIAANSCYSIANVLVDGSSVGAVAAYTFNNVTAAHTIAASFSLNTFTIAASAGAGGSISPSGNVSVNCGANQTFAIAADPCYSIADVLVDGSSVGAVASYTFNNVTAAHTIAASFSLNTYTIAASAGAGGSISPSGSVSVNCGSNQSFTVAAALCYSIADMLVDGSSVGAVASYTFNNVTAAHTIAASFSLNTYTIAASAGSGGSISPSGNVSVNCGANQSFTIAAASCYSIADVLVDGGSVGAVASYTFNNVTAAHTIAASFSLNTYTIAASAGAGGSISPTGNVSVNCGANQSFTIAANSCNSIADVLVDGSSVGAVASYTFNNVTAAHTIAASFSLNASTITASAGTGGSISPSGAVSVNCGANQAFTIAASPCYSIADVLVDGGSVGAVSSYTFSNVTAAHTIAASFSLNTYTIAASAGSGGSISPSGNVSVNCGANQAFTIAAASCYSIADVLVDGGSVGAVASYTFNNVTAAHTIAASFSLNTYTIAASAGAGGSISPSGNVSVNCGSNQSFTIAADPCYSIADVLVDGGSVGAVASYTFSNVTAAHTIAASFSLNTYTITASAGAGGSISPTGSVSVNCGANQSFTIAANSCFAIANVVVDGGSVGTVSSYTFSNVTANHTISASFTALGYTISASAGTGGSITPVGNQMVLCGQNKSFTIAPASCYSISDVLVDGSSVGAVSSYTFTNVSANHTIAAAFSLNTYTITASAGSGGSISPSGSVPVNCGASSVFAVSGDACHSIADVLVDGGSVGAVSSYTFSNVTANHTIAASFSLIAYTITASAGSGGSISPSGAVSVNCGSNQSFTIAANACNSIADVLVDGGSVGAVSSYTFSNVTGAHTIAASFTLATYTITASAGSGGTISPSGAVSVNCGANQSFAIAGDACHHVLDVLVDGSSVGAVASYTFSSVSANHTIAASFAPNAATITAVTGLAAAQQKTGNDNDGTTKIKLTFTAPGGASSVEVWRKGFGSYPTYDNAGGATPSLPGSYPPAGWTLTTVTTAGASDEPATRDFWYYVAYAKDACGNASPVSAMTSGTLDYHLGDVSNGVVAGQGDNTVSTVDVSLLGAHYGVSGGALAGFEYLDVGPTTDHTTDARPTTDSKTDFEDLVMFALNYTPHVSLATKGGASTQSANVLSVEAPTSVVIGQEFDAQVMLTSGGDLLALSTSLGWNSAIVEPLSVTAGDLVTSQGGVVFSPGPGRADAALLGAASSFTGQGTLATVHFRAIANGAPHVGIAGVDGRNSLNQSVTVNISNPLSVEAVVTATDLMPVIPNPARGKAALQYSIATRGAVDLSVFSVDGRRVKTLTHGIQEVGRYRFTWDGSDANGSRIQAGVYFVRLEAPGLQKTRVINLVR